MPTAEELADKFGGDTTHGSWLPAALVAPFSPGEYKAAAIMAKEGIVAGKALLAGSVLGFPVLAARIEKRITKNVNRIDEIQDTIEQRKAYGASDESLEELIKERKQLEFENRGLFDELFGIHTPGQ